MGAPGSVTSYLTTRQSLLSQSKDADELLERVMEADVDVRDVVQKTTKRLFTLNQTTSAVRKKH